ncbi:hypothetical protein [Halococcus sp. IIIV-5B]|uniref:hypothetical protein n=1 Tax=Halococcus sp. IIIV-5B TaxID=2321230 RepID=UPI000E72D8F1|nr:hypothetical protein [Halococcus sp. IIIV-5B]RJT07482.1 hypothetical protein D3261_02445 [Halococcus sp. IIIV-5B]
MGEENGSRENYDGYGELYRGKLKSDPEQEVKALQEKAIECVEGLDGNERTTEGKYLLSSDESVQLFTFFTMTAAVIEELSIILLSEKLTDTEVSSSNSSAKYYESKVSQSQRQKILMHSGIVGTGTHGHMDKIRKHRNEIVHSSRQRKLVEDPDEAKNKINDGMSAVEDLWEKVTQ